MTLAHAASTQLPLGPHAEPAGHEVPPAPHEFETHTPALHALPEVHITPTQRDSVHALLMHTCTGVH